MLSEEEYQARWRALYALLEVSDQEVVSPEQLEAWGREVGWALDADALLALLRHQHDVTLNREGALINPALDTPTLYARALHQLARPAAVEELAASLQEHLKLSAPPTERQIYLHLSRADEVYYVERGVYLHEEHLPLPIEELRALASECITALEGTPHAVSAAALLDEVAARRGDLSPELSSMLLRDVMGRDARIQLFQSTDMVAHLEFFSGKRKTQQDHVADILLAADAPMTCDEVCEAMPAHVSFHRGAIYMALQQADFALNLGQGRFFHRDAIGLTDVMLERLTQRARATLVERGEPLSAPRLLDALGDDPAAAFLRAHSEGAALLYALMGEREDIAQGSGQLLLYVERSSDEVNPVIEALVGILDERTVQTPGELRRAIMARHGWEASPSPIYYALDKAQDQGLVVRLFDSFRALASEDVEALARALDAREDTPREEDFGEDEALSELERALLALLGDEDSADAAG